VEKQEGDIVVKQVSGREQVTVFFDFVKVAHRIVRTGEIGSEVERKEEEKDAENKYGIRNPCDSFHLLEV